MRFDIIFFSIENRIIEITQNWTLRYNRYSESSHLSGQQKFKIAFSTDQFFDRSAAQTQALRLARRGLAARATPLAELVYTALILIYKARTTIFGQT